MRPLWLCRACGAEWPCPAARLCLVARFGGDRVSLAVYLAVLMERAYEDKAQLNPHPGPDAAALHLRFLAWIRPMTARRADGPTPGHSPSAAGADDDRVT